MLGAIKAKVNAWRHCGSGQFKEMDRRPLARPHRGDARVHETDERPIGESSLTSRTRAPSWSLRSFERPGGDFFELTPSALPLSINRNSCQSKVAQSQGAQFAALIVGFVDGTEAVSTNYGQ